MTIETKLCPDPDFFILADSQTSLLLAINLINSSSELYSSSITKVFTIYKNTIVTLGDIVDNKLNSLSHPQVILNKYEGMKLKNDIFDLKKGNDLVTFGMFISNLIKDSINESVYLTEDINDLSIDFLTNARTSNLTFKDLFNSLLKSTKNNDKSHYGVPLVSNVDEYDFLSGIYPNSKFIRLFDDSTEKNKAKPTNQLTNNSNKFLDVTFSQLLNSSKDILLEISAFILKKNDMDLESSFSSQLVNNNLKLNSEYVNNLDHKKPPGAPPLLIPAYLKTPIFLFLALLGAERRYSLYY